MWILLDCEVSTFSSARLSYCGDHFARTVKPSEEEPLRLTHLSYDVSLIAIWRYWVAGSLPLTLVSPSLEAVHRSTMNHDTSLTIPFSGEVEASVGILDDQEKFSRTSMSTSLGRT